MKKIIIISATLIITLLLIISTYAANAVELMNEGRMNIYKGNISEGIRLLEAAEKMDNTNPDIRLLLARAYSWNNEWDRAKAKYADVVKDTDTADQIHWDAKFGIAQVTSWEKKYDEAIKLYREILQLNKKMPDNSRLDINLAIGDVYSWKMDYDKSLEQFNTILAWKPGNVAALNRIAKIYLWMGEYSSSQEYTQKILEIDSKDSESLERKRILDQIKPFEASVGYDYTCYNTKNDKDENVQAHNTMLGFSWQYSVPLKFFAFVTEANQNSIESADPVKASEWNYDVNFKLGGTYRINNLTYVTLEGEYALKAVIFPDYTGDISLSRKLTQHLDVIALYKYTYDKIDSIQTVDTKQYHLFSPGIIFYYNPEIYNKLQFYAETDSKDYYFSVLMQQYFAINPENILQFYLFVSQGRSYMTFSDSTFVQDTTTQSIAVVYSHFFNSSWGIEFSAGMTNCVDSYKNYHGGMNLVYKW